MVNLQKLTIEVEARAVLPRARTTKRNSGAKAAAAANHSTQKRKDYMGVGFKSIIDEEALLDQEYVPTATTVIQCGACDVKVYYHDICNTEEFTKQPGCCHLTFGIKPVTDPVKITGFITLKYRKKAPTFYDIPYTEYLKIKEDRGRKDSA